MCENDKGDKLLKRLENSSHTEWKASNFKDAKGKIYPEGKKAIEEIKKFVDDCVKNIFGVSESDSLNIAGLSDFLYVPDILIEDESTTEHVVGIPSGETLDDGSSIKNKLSEVKILKSTTEKDDYGSVIIQKEGQVNPAIEKLDNIVTGHDNGHGRDGNKTNNGDDIFSAGVDRADGKYWTILDVPIRVFCRDEFGKNYHIVKIHCDKEVKRAKLILNVGIDEDNEENIPITYSDLGTIDGNAVDNLVLNKGTTTIKVLFADNMPHAVLKKLYYENC